MLEILIPAAIGVAALAVAHRPRETSNLVAAAARTDVPPDTTAEDASTAGIGVALSSGLALGVLSGILTAALAITERRRGERAAFASIWPLMTAKNQSTWIEKKLRALRAGDNPLKIGAHTDLKEYEDRMREVYSGLDESVILTTLKARLDTESVPRRAPADSWLPSKPEPSDLANSPKTPGVVRERMLAAGTRDTIDTLAKELGVSFAVPLDRPRTNLPYWNIP